MWHDAGNRICAHKKCHYFAKLIFQPCFVQAAEKYVTDNESLFVKSQKIAVGWEMKSIDRWGDLVWFGNYGNL